MLECSETVTLDDFGTGILVNEGDDDYFGRKNGNIKDDVNSRTFTPLGSRKIANVVIAKNLNLASNQVQVQALEARSHGELFCNAASANIISS